MLDDPLDAARALLLIRFHQQNQVPVQLDVATFDFNHHGEFGGQQRFVVPRPAAVDRSVAQLGGEGIYGPLGSVGGHHVAVGHQQQRAILPGAVQPRHEIHALGIGADQFAGDALRIGHFLQVLSDTSFVAGRVGGIQPDQIERVLTRTIRERTVVLGESPSREHARDGADSAHLYSEF